MRHQQGFSLIELVVVLSVMSILAVLASGSFVSFNAKAQSAEALTVIEGVQTAYKTRYTEDGRVPPSVLTDVFGAGSLPHHHMGKFVATTDIDGGVIVVTYGLEADSQINGKILTLTPYETGGGGLLWQCGLSGVPVDALAAPLSVAGTSAGAPIAGTLAATDVPDEFLPRDCRL